MKKLHFICIFLIFLFPCGQSPLEAKSMDKTQKLILKYSQDGDYANLVKIVKDGVSVNFTDENGDTPLLAALGPAVSAKDKVFILPVDKEVIDGLIRLINKEITRKRGEFGFE